MPSVDLPPSLHDQILLLAQAWKTSPANVIQRLLEEFRRPHQPAGAGPSDVQVHVIYRGHRVEALYSPASDRLTITTGPLANQTFRSPSGAAIAVIKSHNPQVNPNRNGWSFWLVTETGRPLQSLRTPAPRAI